MLTKSMIKTLHKHNKRFLKFDLRTLSSSIKDSNHHESVKPSPSHHEDHHNHVNEHGDKHNHEHDHDHEHEHEHPHAINFFEERRITQPWNITRHINEQKRDMLDLIEYLREPIKNAEQKLVSPQKRTKDLEQLEKEYASFLAENFKNAVLKKYPDYRKDLDRIKNEIKDFHKLNPYQQEVEILDTYMQNVIKDMRIKSFEMQEPENVKGTTKLEQDYNHLQDRLKILSKLVPIQDGDTKLLKNLKQKLKKVLDNNYKYSTFILNYSKEAEAKILDKVIQNEKLGYSTLSTIKTNELKDLKSSHNPHFKLASITPHDHFDITNWASNADQLLMEREKYLAYYDLVIDQHLRRVRPENLDDNETKYAGNIRFNNLNNDFTNNTLFDHTCTLDGEFYRKFMNEMKSFFESKEIEDHHRPIGKHWEEQYKYPHVADRLGWEILYESSIDKNPFIERVESNPTYQWQPFVQTPYLSAHESLDLELGETIYEDKFAREWVWLYKILFLLPVIFWTLALSTFFENNIAPSPQWFRRFGDPLNLSPNNPILNLYDEGRFDKFIYWGKDMWTYQHWVRKFLLYPSLIVFLTLYFKYFIEIGSNNVLKACFNRSKDVVFIYMASRLGRKMIVTELHHLEKPLSHMPYTWKAMGDITGNKHGSTFILDLRCNDVFIFRTDPKYWNYCVKSYFDQNVSTYWQGAASKDINRGLKFNNSLIQTTEEFELRKKIREELTEAIRTHGPLQKHDYEHSYSYQLKKRLNEYRINLLAGSNH